MFTKVTMITAGVWIVLCMVTIKLFSSQDPWAGSSTGKHKVTAPAEPGKAATTDESGAATTEEGASSGDSKDAAKQAPPSETPASSPAADTSKAADQPAAPAKE